MLTIDKELFQWEKGRYVNISSKHPEITTVEFYNKKSPSVKEIYVEDGRAQIPNVLLKDSLPIMALACIEDENGTKVVSRKAFKVFARPRPEYYIDDEETPDYPEIPGVDIVYDGGVIE